MRVAFGGVGIGLIPPSHGNAFSITLIANKEILLTTPAPQGVFNFSSVSFVQINVRLLAVLVVRYQSQVSRAGREQGLAVQSHAEASLHCTAGAETPLKLQETFCQIETLDFVL